MISIMVGGHDRNDVRSASVHVKFRQDLFLGPAVTERGDGGVHSHLRAWCQEALSGGFPPWWEG